MNPPLRLYFSNPALDDGFEITHESEFPIPASWLNDLQEVLDRLTQFPAMGRLPAEFRAGLRSFMVGSFVVFYQFDSEELEIVRVLHGARDIEPLFRDN